jgi:hypothetical protein
MGLSDSLLTRIETRESIKQSGAGAREKARPPV